MSVLTLKLILIGLAALAVVAVVYAVTRRKDRQLPPPDLGYAPGSAADPARDVFAAAGDGEPPTEDQIARARLGGPRGAPQLGQAPLPRQAREQMPGKIDDGHTA